ncbi:MAG: COX15/CtaA family protein [Bacteroidetes bacterium]|nr:COX15/CtaA family protein [Bacteroidota bacterium]
MNKAFSPSSRPVAIWLLVGVGMIIVQVLLGGITRLSGSGLSITEWEPVKGALPPLSEQQWLLQFEKYKQTPQYHLLNFDFTLKDFKFIFFWEWFHRFWARLIGVVFLVPFIIFIVQKRFKQEMIRPMIILFLLGALQGAVGWIMVASGLTGDAVYVEPTRLALHFIFALGLLCYTFWFALLLLVPGDKMVINAPLRKLNWLLLVVVFIQLLYGALMAGHKAAAAAPTWPDINGAFIPSNLFPAPDGMLNLLENKITIHFIHRSLAYFILLLIILWTVRAYSIKSSSLFNKTKLWPVMIVCLQVLLGIFSVLTSIKIVPNKWGLFEWVAQLHQLVAMLLLLSLVWMLYLVRDKQIKQ